MRTLILLLFASQAAMSEIVPIDHLTPSEVKRFISFDSELICEIPEGSTIPIELSLSGDLIELLPTTNSLIAKTTLYLRNSSCGPLLSFDAIDWHHPLEFLTGQLDAGVNFDRNYPVFKIHADLLVK